MALTVTRKCLCCKRFGTFRAHCEPTCSWWICTQCNACCNFRMNRHNGGTPTGKKNELYGHTSVCTGNG